MCIRDRLSIRLFIPWQPFYCGYTNTSNFRWQQYYSLQWLFSLELDYLRFWSKSSAITGKCSAWYTLFYVLDVRWNSPILWKCFSLWSALWTRHTSKALNWQISKYQEELIAHVPKCREYHFIWPNLFLQHFYAQLATQGSSWLELSTIIMTLFTARPHSLMIGHQYNACKYKGHHRNQRLAFYLSLLFST